MQTPDPLFVRLAPPAYQRMWEAMSDAQKQVLARQASLRQLNEAKDVEDFWQTRNFETMLHEARHIQSATPPKDPDPLAIAMKRLI